jgi:hypothetical protein
MSDTRDRMQDAGRAAQVILPPGTGFVLLAFDFDMPGQNPTGRLDYVSNANRADVCRAMIGFIHKTAEGFAEHELERLLTRSVEPTEEECKLVRWALLNGGVTEEHPTFEKFR